MRVGSLFSGIGGFDLGLERAGMEIIWQCEIDPFCNKVLAKHWPNVKRYGDIKELNGSELEPVDLICGGFPCQPYSCAGKRMGAEDDRALWPEMLRVIQEARPRWVIGENVAGFINMGLDQSISDLEREGYTVQAFIIPACAVNAPHRRDRVWIIAHSAESGLSESRPAVIGKFQAQGRTGIYNRLEQQNCHATDTTNAGVESLRRERENSVFQNSYAQDSPSVGCGSRWTEREGQQRRVSPDGPDCHASNAKSEQTQPTESRGFYSESSSKDSDVADTSNQGLQRSEKAGNTSVDRKESRNELLGGCHSWEEPWIEVAQRFCKLDAGLPSGLARCLTYPETYGIIGFMSFLREYHYGKINEDWRTEVLPILQHAFNTEQVSELFGRFHPFFTEEILRCPVHGTSHDERYGDKIGVSLQGEKTQGKQVREVRIDNDSFNSPHRRGYTEQCSCEFDDIVCELSSEIALGEWKGNTEKAENILFNLWKESRGERFLYEPLSALYEIWRSVTDKEIGSFRRHYHKRDEHRVQKLKALGNAVVPQIVEIIGRAIMEIENSHAQN